MNQWRSGLVTVAWQVITACLIDFQDYTGPESDEFLIMSSVPIDGKESEKETMAAQLHGDTLSPPLPPE